jgi:hypothetical protein
VTEEPLVDILLAAHNGAPFLREQLDSIRRQTYSRWRLLIRDDGSTDNTPEIIKAYARRDPSRIRIISDHAGRLGPRGNFARLLELSTAPYVAFSDQDDVWLPNKIELTLQRMLTLEKRYGATTPLLVHTDRIVVDEALKVVHHSFWKYQYLLPHAGRSWKRQLVENAVAGSTALVNRPLRNLAIPIPLEAIMHDWWVALLATLFGRAEAVTEPTVLYRQHPSSHIGAKPWGLRFIAVKLAGIMRGVDAIALLRRCRSQAAALLVLHGDKLDPVTRRTVQQFAELDSMPAVQRRLFLLRNGIMKTGVLRNIGLLLLV